jgi:iron complex outermembrane recepter protein
MNLRVRGRSRVIDVLLIAALAVAGPIPAFATETHLFDVPAEDAPSAIRDFASQAHVQILVAGENVSEKRLHPVAGEFSTEEGLRLLLVDSGLSPQYVGDRSIALVKASDANSPSQGIAKEGKKSSSGEFRLAQVDQGANSQSSAVGSNVSGTQENENKVGLEEIIVTAQKREERLQDVPIPVTAVDAQTLTDSGQVRLRDYVTMIPGLSVTPAGAFGGTQTFAIRGITTGGNTNPTVGVTIDDVPFGASTFTGGGNVMPDIDPSDLARVEVLRGPQGTLYGASSMGGLIKYVTLDPSTDALSGRIEAGTENVYNAAQLAYDVRGSVNVPLSSTLAVRVSGFYRSDPGYINDPAHAVEGVNADEAYGGHLSALWKPAENFSVKLSALVQDIIADGNALSEPSVGNLAQSFIRGAGAWDTRVQAYSATVSGGTDSIHLTSVTGYNKIAELNTEDASSFFGALTSSKFGVAGALLAGANPVDKFTEEFRLSTAFGPHIDWLVGLFDTHETTSILTQLLASEPSTGEIVGTGIDFFIPYTYKEYAAFTDFTFHVVDRLDIQVGARESHIEQESGSTDVGPFVPLLEGGVASPFSGPTVGSSANAFTYLVTPEYHLTPDWMLYVRVATGYRPGGANATVVPGVPDQVNPDKTQNYELGVKGDALDHTLSIDASAYYIDWKGLQLELETPTGITYTANGSDAKSQGFELSITARPLSGLKVASWVAWNDAVLTQPFPAASTAVGADGDRLPYAARFSGTLSVDEAFDIAQNLSGFVGVSESYTGDRVGLFQATEERQDLPGYAQANLRAGINYGTWTLRLFANNLFDKRGVLDGGLDLVPTTAYEYIQPRTIGASIADHF